MSEEESTIPQEEKEIVDEPEPDAPPANPRDLNLAPDPPADIDTEKASSPPPPKPEPKPVVPPPVIKPAKKPKPKRKPKPKPPPKTKPKAEVLTPTHPYTLPKGLNTLPDFFLTPASDEVARQIQMNEALDWMCGVGKPTSYSALLTYIGPRRNANPLVHIAKRAINPKQGNWRVWRTNIVFWKDVEKRALVKDPIFIQKALTPKGGSRRYTIRFVQDDTFQKGAEIGRVMKTTLAQIAAFPLRIRQGRLILGLHDTPLLAGEAVQVLQNIKLKPELLSRLQEDSKKKLVALLETRVKADAVQEKENKNKNK